jgi:NADH:ubiquinone oxidoreductase subunit F (NADH-binding)
MYSSTFIFAKKQYDEEFYRLDQAIAEAAKEIPGYLGEEEALDIAWYGGRQKTK